MITPEEIKAILSIIAKDKETLYRYEASKKGYL